MAESKVQKVAKQGAKVRVSAGTCTCGNALLWAKLIGSGKPKMVKLCEKCSTFYERGK